MKATKPISLEEARAIVKEKITPGRTERIPVSQACGRVLAVPVFSDIDVTPFDDSAMDGFAIIAADVAAATPDTPVQLRCVAHIGAGSYYAETLAPGECVRIMTGAPVPAGADTVVRIEDVTYSSAGTVGDAIAFSEPAKLGRHIRHAGEEAHKGDIVMMAGDVIQPAGVGLLAGCGNLEVTVFARPVVGLITIGSELVDAHEVPGPGMIRDTNRWAMEALICAAGGVPRVYPRVSDDAETIRATYAQAAEECDVVVSTGGACAGDFDLTPDIVADLGELFFTRVAIKPGKSQPFGRIGTTPVFVLSGNPGAASAGFEMYVRPALRIVQGYGQVDRPIVMAQLENAIAKKEPRAMLVRGFMKKAADGTHIVSQFHNQSSALYGSFQNSNCLIHIPTGMDSYPAGTEVPCIMTSVDEGLAPVL